MCSLPAPGPSDDVRPVRRALVSVYDKTGLADLARALAEAGVELVSTGGSAALIDSLGLPVTKVEDLTGFPECLEGRVKTLHPRCLLYTSPSPRDRTRSRMPSSA